MKGASAPRPLHVRLCQVDFDRVPTRSRGVYTFTIQVPRCESVIVVTFIARHMARHHDADLERHFFP